MIDEKHQGQGYGTAALGLARQHVRSQTRGTRLVSSYRRGEFGPEGFYLKYGFRRPAACANGTEIEIAMDA
jgi:GNAT superfamily N-acetyltransferase